MDSRGWIPIPLIASFNRVIRLTSDPQMVRDVLTLSSIVQVLDNSVRMLDWEKYVLPDAAPSVVEGGYTMQTTVVDDREAGEEEEEDEEDEEEDVVFVLGREALGWTDARH